MLRWFIRILLVILVLAIAGAGYAYFNAQQTLDRSRAHSAAVADFPVFNGSQTDGDVQIEASGMRFRARLYGLDNDGPGLVLLHGFPESSAMWAPLAQAADAAGYRVLAFDQRGYSPGARPDGVEAYAGDLIVADALAVADAVGFDQFHLVGHDWGSMIGWGVAIQHPERLLSWTAISIPHPDTLRDAIFESPPSYVRLFQLPVVPETWILYDDAALPRSLWAPHPEDEVEDYLAILTEPGALTSALNWYRAIPLTAEQWFDADMSVAAPTLFIWGSREIWVSPERIEAQEALMRGPYETLELDAGHWVIQEQTEATVSAILAHLSANSRDTD